MTTPCLASTETMNAVPAGAGNGPGEADATRELEGAGIKEACAPATSVGGAGEGLDMGVKGV